MKSKKLSSDEYMTTIINSSIAGNVTALIEICFTSIEFDNVEEEAKLKSKQSQILHRKFVDAFEAYFKKNMAGIYTTAIENAEKEHTKHH